MSRYDGLIIPRSYSEYINKTDAATLQQALQLSGVLSGAVAAGDNKAVTSNAVNSALGGYQKTQTYYVDTDGGTVSIGLRNSPNLYFVCWGYETYVNSAFVQYSYDWRGPQAKLIILKQEDTGIPAPKAEIKDNKLVITHQYGNGTCMLVCSLG